MEYNIIAGIFGIVVGCIIVYYFELWYVNSKYNRVFKIKKRGVK